LRPNVTKASAMLEDVRQVTVIVTRECSDRRDNPP
jgi:hypothetical protein